MDVARIHILVVDDLRDAADSMVELLSIWGFDAIARYDGISALQSARHLQPTVILLDLVMPRMDGFKFTDLLRKLPGCGSIPIIAMSGYTGLAFRARAREAGILLYLVKPTDPQCVKDLLECEIKSAMSLAPFLKSSALLSCGLHCEAQEALSPPKPISRSIVIADSYLAPPELTA
jgi:CheY-like chemotaxis protein